MKSPPGMEKGSETNGAFLLQAAHPFNYHMSIYAKGNANDISGDRRHSTKAGNATNQVDIS